MKELTLPDTLDNIRSTTMNIKELVERYDIRERSMSSLKKFFIEFREKHASSLEPDFFLDDDSVIGEGAISFYLFRIDFVFKEHNDVMKDMEIVVVISINCNCKNLGRYYVTYNNKGEMVEEKIDLL